MRALFQSRQNERLLLLLLLLIMIRTVIINAIAARGEEATYS
jgi:hypothetical protein